jgi:hypothetical protein
MENLFETDLIWRTKTRELDLVKKKKKTLDELFETEKISGATHEYLDKKLSEESTNLEAKLKSLSDSMTARAQELEEQIGHLEISLANLEMQYAISKLDEISYENQNKIILLNLEAKRNELKGIKNSLLNTFSESLEIQEEPVEEKETQVEEQLDTEVQETLEKTENEIVETEDISEEITSETTLDEPTSDEPFSFLNSENNDETYNKIEASTEY